MNSETIPEIESHLKILITEENPTWDVYDLYLGAHSSHIGALRKGVSHHDLRQWRGVLSAKIKTCHYVSNLLKVARLLEDEGASSGEDSVRGENVHLPGSNNELWILTILSYEYESRLTTNYVFTS